MTQTSIRRRVLPQCAKYPATAGSAPSVHRRWSLLAMLAVVLFPGLVRADIEVRVESRPVSAPIEVYVTVTDVNGQPVGGLSVDDFTVTLDGSPITIESPNFTLPPSQNVDRRVSVVFAMDYSPSTEGEPRIVMQEAVVTFINAMTPGDYASIVKFNNSQGASVVQPLTLIDGAAGSSMLVSAAMAPYPGSGTNLFDATIVALEHISAPPVPLPDGPRAVIVISDGNDNTSAATLVDAVDEAGTNGIPVFSIALASASPSGQNVLNALAARTGGDYIETTSDTAITTAYETISSLLDNGYLLSFQSTISDCNQHTIEVEVTGQSAPSSVRFTRCDAVTPPPPPPPNPGGGGGGGGGGGAMGVAELIAGLAMLVAGRRRRVVSVLRNN